MDENQQLLSARARKIIELNQYLTVATICEDGTPWITPLWYAYDSSFNFFWWSAIESLHSTNIRRYDNIAIVIYDSSAPEGTGEGVYMQAQAVELSGGDELELALDVYNARTQVERLLLRNYQGDSPVRFYRAIPKRVWINTEGSAGTQVVDMRTAIKLLSGI